jgi:serine/threonine protein kinase
MFVTFDLLGLQETNNTKTGNRPQHEKSNSDHLLYIILAVVGVTLVLLVLFIMYVKKRHNLKPEPEGISKGNEVETLLPSEELPPIDLQDVLSQGQFCIVRKGRMGYKNVAVKIFPIAQCSKPTPSALTETDIYMVCKLSHENILKFIGKHLQEEGSQQQLWLVTEYIEQGSLSDFLKRSTISWENIFHMAQGMAHGMAYLHAEIPRVKPSIAHRDIKSKNILVKNNLTCCISDFGLSLKFDNKDGPGDTHGQVTSFFRITTNVI